MIKIGCDLCGECCRRSRDRVPLTIFDLIRIAKAYSLGKAPSLANFKIKLDYVGGAVDGWAPLPYLVLPCDYLDQNRCGIYPYRPLTCISYPYRFEATWKEDSSCYMIRELFRAQVNNQRISVPRESLYASQLHDLALSATMYQFNLPIFDLDENQLIAFQRIGFRDLIDKGMVKYLVYQPPVLEHFNVNQDHVTVIDRKRRMFADVYFRNNHVYCELCEEENCEHVDYVLNLPKVQKILRKKGWIIEEGEIIQRPY